MKKEKKSCGRQSAFMPLPSFFTLLFLMNLMKYFISYLIMS
jgi:hypothetical protein